MTLKALPMSQAVRLAEAGREPNAPKAATPHWLVSPRGYILELTLPRPSSAYTCRQSRRMWELCLSVLPSPMFARIHETLGIHSGGDMCRTTDDGTVLRHPGISRHIHHIG